MQTAPLQLQTIEGQPFNPMEHFHNTPLLVLFYHTSCLGCTGRALPLAYKLSQEFPKVQLIVVHVDFASIPVGWDDIVGVFTNATPPFPIYLDPGASNFEKFGCEGTPHWLIFDKSGSLQHSIFGSQPNAQNRLYYALMELEQQ